MKGDLIEKVKLQRGRRFKILRELKIPRSTYYTWRKAYEGGGREGLKKMRSERRIWNRLSAGEVQRVLEIARLHPELSPRLLAVKITDEEEFSISESTVYRILKGNGLISPRPLEEMPAQKQWRDKTTRPDELWQCDATNLFVVSWGYYKLIPVEDDFSRKIIAQDVRPDESAFSLSDILEMGLENARKEGHLTGNDSMPKLYSDNGSGFTSTLLAAYLSQHGIKHIFGTPYHPQGRGKIERFNRRIKEKLCLVVYCSPDELKKAVDQSIATYNSTPHESLDNVTPNDVYAGRREAIIQRRKEKKRLTLERRKQYNLNMKYKGPDHHRVANSG
ncbi:MAG TPA: DDE-type integrase/transposase/recombinase [Thermodesulfobacteriota bacterium]|nr:DDE-type integrase/transposase/recombinase [Thermodesulfobacteriota bacterium]